MTLMNSMMLVSSLWNETPSFRLVPLTQDCPYVEGIYDPENKTLALIGRAVKSTFRYIPKVDTNGQAQSFRNKSGQPQPAMDRKQIDTFHEYYLTNREDIERFILAMSINSNSFDTKKILDSEVKMEETSA